MGHHRQQGVAPDEQKFPVQLGNYTSPLQLTSGNRGSHLLTTAPSAKWY